MATLKRSENEAIDLPVEWVESINCYVGKHEGRPLIIRLPREASEGNGTSIASRPRRSKASRMNSQRASVTSSVMSGQGDGSSD